MKVNKICEILQVDKLAAPVLVLSGDEIEIRPGMTYVPTMGYLVGSINGPLREKELSEESAKSISSQLASKVMLLYLTTIEGTACRPFAYIPSATINAKVLFDKVSK